jgi:hypothetical protein
MANYRPFKPIVSAQFARYNLTWQSPVESLKYIGPYLQQRLNQRNITTLYNLIQYILRDMFNNNNDDPIIKAFEAIAPLVINENAQQCQQSYLARPLNRMGFNIIADLLQHARSTIAQWPEAGLNIQLQSLPANIGGVLICQINEGQQPRPLGPNGEVPETYCNKQMFIGNVGPEVYSMRTCPCITDANSCTGDCMWVPGMPGEPSACISRISRSDRGNITVDETPFSGDWNDEYPQYQRPHTRYVPVPPTGPGRDGFVFALPIRQVQNRNRFIPPYNNQGRGNIGNNQQFIRDTGVYNNQPPAQETFATNHLTQALPAAAQPMFQLNVQPANVVQELPVQELPNANNIKTAPFNESFAPITQRMPAAALQTNALQTLARKRSPTPQVSRQPTPAAAAQLAPVVDGIDPYREYLLPPAPTARRITPRRQVRRPLQSASLNPYTSRSPSAFDFTPPAVPLPRVARNVFGMTPPPTQSPK